jgi:molybdopterin-guanine dinucleotide biosynthesis protein A
LSRLAERVASTSAFALGCVVLAGGRGQRLGHDKASYPFEGTPMLRRVTDELARLDVPMAVVTAPTASIPALVASVRWLRDDRPHAGPLHALASLEPQLDPRLERLFVVGTDHPRLRAELVVALAELLGDREAVIPLVDGRPQPLVALYRRSVLLRARTLVAEGETRMLELVRRTDARLVEPSELLADPHLARVDPRLASLADVDHPADAERLSRET